MHDQENISKVVQNFHHNQLQGMAGPAGAAAVMGAFAIHDRMRQADADSANNAAMLNQQQIMNKQMFIQNCLLQGWTMDEVNEEIAAGEAMRRQWQVEAQAAEAARAALSGGIAFGFFVAVGLTLWFSVLSEQMAPWPAAFVYLGIPLTLQILWIRLLRRNAAKRLSNGV